jgi:hypothetical protein
MFKISKDKTPQRPTPKPPVRQDESRSPQRGRFVKVPAQQAPTPDPQPVKKK